MFMKPSQRKQTFLKKKQDEGSVKVLKKYKSGGVLQVQVKIIQKSSSVKSMKTLSNHETPSNSEKSVLIESAKVLRSSNLNPVRLSPGDFIEPYEDLSIPSTIDYVSFSKHNPTKSMDDVISPPNSARKPPRPQKIAKDKPNPLQKFSKSSTLLRTKLRDKTLKII